MDKKADHPERSAPSAALDRYRRLIEAARQQFESCARSVSRTSGSKAPGGAAPVADLPGYELIAEIHRGGQGVVYQARQRSTGRTVAIKVMREGPFSGPRDRARFEREVQILAQLNHPNIVGIVDSGAAAGSAYFVMDFVRGDPLDKWISDFRFQISDSKGAAPKMGNLKSAICNLLRLFAKICGAVHAAHLHGITHRDLKPSNILVDAGGEPHVLDFGLAKLDVGGGGGGDPELMLTAAGHFIGSLPWASPEQARGAPGRIDIRTDVYSLGVVLYRALTGQFPYSVAGSTRDVLDRIMTADPARPSAVRRGIDDELDTMVLKCLAKEPQRRYESAGELARDLRHYLHDEPIEAKRDSAWYVLRKTLQRYRVSLAVASLFLVLLVASAVVASILSLRASRAAATARRAESAATAAEQRALGNLHAALIAQARATRQSGWTGQRADALAALQRAAVIQPTLDARNEAIAALALADFSLIREFRRGGNGHFDSEFTRCAVLNSDHSVDVIRIADEAELAHIPPPAAEVAEMHRLMLCGPWLARMFDPPVGNRHVEIWRVADAALVLELDDVPFQARFDFSPDGRRLAIGRLDQAIHIFDLESMHRTPIAMAGDSGAPSVQRIALDRMPSYVTFQPDGRRLVLYHGGFLAAELLDLETGAREPIFESHAIAWSVAWHPGGTLVAGAAVANVELWDADQRQRIAQLAGHEEQIVYLTFSHDGTKLMSYSWDGVTILWDVRSRRALLRTRLGWPAFSPDNRQVAGTVGNRIRLLDFECGAPRRQLIAWDDVQATAGVAGAFEPHSGLLLMVNQGIAGRAIPVLRVYDPESEQEIARQPLPALFSLAVESAGRFVLTSGEGGLLRWPLHSEPGHLTMGPAATLPAAAAGHAIGLSADGMTLVAGVLYDGAFTVLDMRSGVTRSLQCKGRASSVRISPDGRWISMGSWFAPGTEVWDAASRQRVANLPTVGTSWVEFSPDSASLATSDAEGIRVWATGDWRQVRQSPQTVGLLGFSPDGRLLTASPDRMRIRLIDFATLEEVATFEPPESYYTSGCAFSPDGALLAQFTNRNGVVHLWDLRRLRADLAAIGLDWDHPPYPPVSGDGHVSWQVSVDAGAVGVASP